MNKKITLLSALLFISMLSLSLFTSCDKDTNCYLDVLVVDEATRTPIPGAKIVINQTGGSVYDEGVTGENGVYSTHFNAPAVLYVNATLDMGNSGERRGNGAVRLVEGEVKTVTIPMPADIYY
ncbi:MAG: hypothetical protein IKR33_05845 [Bacteroidales bacterium]|nr:hypothetical protein [Bacteroidales bacterium]